MKQMLLNTREEWIELFTAHLTDVGDKIGVSMEFIRAISGKAKKSLKLNTTIPNTSEVRDMVNVVLTISKEHENHKVGGQPFRCSPLDLTTQVEKFITTYDYSLKTIYDAFVLYMSEVYDGRDNSKMTTLYYFVMKQGSGSRLATYCDMILEGTQVDTYSFTNVL